MAEEELLTYQGMPVYPAIWADLTIGSMLYHPGKKRAWRVLEFAIPAQHEVGRSLWTKIQDCKTGEITAIPPRAWYYAIHLVQTGEPLAPPPLPEGALALALLVRKLGADVVCEIDNETGIVTCPTWMHTRPQDELDHLRIAHGLKVDDSLDVKGRVTLHGQAHSPRHYPDLATKGFAHRHVGDEELAALDSRRI